MNNNTNGKKMVIFVIMSILATISVFLAAATILYGIKMGYTPLGVRYRPGTGTEQKEQEKPRQDQQPPNGNYGWGDRIILDDRVYYIEYDGKIPGTVVDM